MAHSNPGRYFDTDQFVLGLLAKYGLALMGD